MGLDMLPRLRSFNTGLLFTFLCGGWDWAKAAFPEGNCTSTGWDWTFNPAGQTPCQVANQLTSGCNLHFNAPEVALGFPIDTTDDHCLCNTIIYSLIYACNGCQRKLPPNAITWNAWLFLNNCTDASKETRVNVTTTALHSPLPTGADVVVPGWAFLPNMSDEADAWPSQTVELMAIASAKNTAFPDSTVIGPTPSTSTSGSAVTTPTLSPNKITPASGLKKASNTGAIVGGVVGGLGVLVIFFLAIVLLMRHCAKRSRQQARHLNIPRTRPSSDPFHYEPRWKPYLPDESLSTYSSEIAMEPMQDRRRELTSSPLSRAATIPLPAQPTSASSHPPTLVSDARSMTDSNRTASRNPYSVQSVLSRAESTVSRNPFFQIAAADGTLTHQDIERHATRTTSSRATSQHFESLI